MADFAIDTKELDALNKELANLAKSLDTEAIKNALVDSGKYETKVVERCFSTSPSGKPWPQILMSSYIRRGSGNKGSKGAKYQKELRAILKNNPRAKAPSGVKPFSTWTGNHSTTKLTDKQIEILPTRAKNTVNEKGVAIVNFAHPPRLSGKPITKGNQPERISFEMVEKDAKEILAIFDRAVERSIKKAIK